MEKNTSNSMCDIEMETLEENAVGFKENSLNKRFEVDTQVDKDNVRHPKKRGRKRKSEQANTKPTSDDPDEKLELSTTRRGRTRKSVNYFALANPDIDDAIEEKIQKVTDKSVLAQDDEDKHIIKPPKIVSFSTNNDVEKENITIKTEPDQNNSLEYESDGTVSIINTTVADNLGKETNVQEKCSDSEEVPRSRKVYRKSGATVELMNTLLSQADLRKNIPISNDSVPKSSTGIKRGRPSKSKKIIQNESLNPVVGDNIFSNHKTVNCAVCNKEMEKSHWLHHKQRYHNNLAWRVGEPALDLNDTDLVKYILNTLYLAKKPFHCDICDKSVKSVQGFLSHKSVCGKESEDVKVTCELCGRKMLPVSMQSHLRFYHADKDKVEEAPKRLPTKIVACKKRQAAEKALSVIKNFNLETFDIKPNFSKYFEDISYISSKQAMKILDNQIEASNRVECKYPNCNFECFTSKDIKNHLKFCIKKPENGYVCKYCLHVQLNIADMLFHIESTHNIITEDEEKIEDFEKIYRKNNKQSNNKKISLGDKDRLLKKWPKFLLPQDRSVDVIYEKAYEWTLKFCEINFSSVLPEEHFQCLKSDWDYMDLDLVEEYLPQMPYSCDVGFETVSGFQDVLHKDHTFRKFELFESYLENNGNSTIFCGGPITALSWMPTPYDHGGLHQIVAVATKSHPDAQHETHLNYNEKCFIQFWDVGPLKNSDTSLFRPRQAFCLKFDHGPVWDLQWCPSNCFDLSEHPDHAEKLRRMGVLAVAGSDSFVYIYSIPNFRESGQFYNARPVLVLNRNVFEGEKLGGMDYYPTRMSWTKASGHRYIAVGYSNGQVALYDLWSKSQLLRHKTKDNIDVLMPYTVLDAHCHSITAIALHHSHGGCKWLMTGSYDRSIRTWDLKERTCVRAVKGNIVNDAVWMTHWMCHIIGYDEASTIGNACSAIIQCKDGLSDPLYLFHCSSAITTISTSDWLNGIVQANSVGEIFATFPKQLMINLNIKNMKNKKLLFGYNTLVEKDKTVEERLKVNSEKQNALRNKLKVKTKISTKEIPSNREVMHLDYNPHYFEYEPLVYHEMDEKYGLIFCDQKMKKWTDFPPNLQEQLSHSSEKCSPSRPNMYPLQSITKIQFNMNRQASIYYASGYQAGFLRLTYMKFLDSDPHVCKDWVKTEQ